MPDNFLFALNISARLATGACVSFLPLLPSSKKTSISCFLFYFLLSTYSCSIYCLSSSVSSFFLSPVHGSLYLLDPGSSSLLLESSTFASALLLATDMFFPRSTGLFANGFYRLIALLSSNPIIIAAAFSFFLPMICGRGEFSISEVRCSSWFVWSVGLASASYSLSCGLRSLLES